MTFDTDSNLFNPDGRLLQMEYALKSTDNSSAVIFMRENNKIKIFTESKFKPFNLTNNILILFSGIPSDFNSIKYKLLTHIMEYQYKHGVEIDLYEVVLKLSDIFQWATINEGRPYALEVILVDRNHRTYIVSSDGNFSEYVAGAIGRKRFEAMEMIENGGDGDKVMKEIIQPNMVYKYKLSEGDEGLFYEEE